MEVDLLQPHEAVSTARIDKLARGSVCRVSAHVFDEEIGLGHHQAFDHEGRLEEPMAHRIIGIPERRDHSANLPATAKLMRPWELKIRLVTGPGHRWVARWHRNANR